MADERVSITEDQYLPGDQPIRTGPTQIAPWEHFDTPFSGYSQTWNFQKGVTFFDDGDRCKDPMLCDLDKPMEFSNDIEFHANGFALELEFEDPILYEIVCHYTQLQLWKQKAMKNYIWASRIGAGGGIWGSDMRTNAFLKNNGFPSSENYKKIRLPWIFPAGKTWRFVAQMMELTGTSGPNDPRNPVVIFNRDVGEEIEPTRKLLRLYMLGYNFQDTTNT